VRKVTKEDASDARATVRTKQEETERSVKTYKNRLRGREGDDSVLHGRKRGREAMGERENVKR
jgi:hypothetical protein